MTGDNQSKTPERHIPPKEFDPLNPNSLWPKELNKTTPPTPHMPIVLVVTKMLVVTKNRTLPFSKACPTPLKNNVLLLTKELESSYSLKVNSLKVNADCTAAFATHPRIWFCNHRAYPPTREGMQLRICL